MRPFFATAGGAIALVLASLLLFIGCAPPALTTNDGPASGTEDRRLLGARSQTESVDERPEGKTLSASIPERDARGKPVPDLPRLPGSVRVGYSEKEADGLKLVRAAYVTAERPDGVRGFYRGVFRSGGWQVANVEYSRSGWHFLVLRGGREAGVEILPRGGGSKVEIEFSGPVGGAQDSSVSTGGSKR